MLLVQNDGQVLHQKQLHFKTTEIILKSVSSRAWGQLAGW